MSTGICIISGKCVLQCAKISSDAAAAERVAEKEANDRNDSGLIHCVSERKRERDGMNGEGERMSPSAEGEVRSPSTVTDAYVMYQMEVISDFFLSVCALLLTAAHVK